MKYTANDIKVLRWPGPIRKRPDIYLKKLGTEGCLLLMSEIIKSIALKDYGASATVVNFKRTRHKEMIITYNGIGMPIDLSLDSSIPYPIMYESLMTFKNFSVDEIDFKTYGHLAEIGPIFNAVCEQLLIRTVRNGLSYEVCFSGGCISSPMKESKMDHNLNEIRFVFDSAVMGACELEESFIVAFIEKMTQSYPAVEFTYSS